MSDLSSKLIKEKEEIISQLRNHYENIIQSSDKEKDKIQDELNKLINTAQEENDIEGNISCKYVYAI